MLSGGVQATSEGCVTTAVVMMYAGLATRFLRDGRCSQTQVYVDRMILHGKYDHVVSATEGLYSIVYPKGPTAGMLI